MHFQMIDNLKSYRINGTLHKESPKLSKTTNPTVEECIIKLIEKESPVLEKNENTVLKARRFVEIAVELNNSDICPLCRRFTLNRELKEDSFVKHCYICGRCVMNYDHHCVFLFNCIAQDNLVEFIMMTIGFALVGMVGMVAVSMAFHHNVYLKKGIKLDWARLYGGQISWQRYSRLLMNETKHMILFMLCLKYFAVGTVMASITLIKLVAIKCWKKGKSMLRQLAHPFKTA